jgi:pSer/pThr/pTyr-binding forkhead associated (FHA) protein
VPELVVLNGARAGAVFELPDMPTVVGRSPEAHFQLDDPWISSMHAMFERRGADIWVVDLESRNGTFVGAERVQEAQLQPGTVLRFGRTEVRLERRGARPRHPSTRHPTPPAARAASRPTGRLDASTTSSSLVRGVPQPSEALPLAPRTVALLRLALHLPPATPVPGGDLIRAGLNALYRAALNEGGLVVRLGGSGALAVFGLAGPSPDDAEFALRAARAAREDVSGIGAGLEVRAAVDAGEVLVGNVSGPDGFELAALGEVAERAEKVLAMAGAGEILVGPGAAGASGLEPVARPRTGRKGIEVSRAR